MKFEGKGIVIPREAAINALKEICDNNNDGTWLIDLHDAIEAIEKLMPIAFLCDRRACEKCSFPTCKHTFNINHAKNFKKEEQITYIEEERGQTNE